MQTPDDEIVAPVALCDARGELNAAARGWSRTPLHRCNLAGRFPRKKRWDYWCVLGKRFLFSATIAHIDYAGLAAIYFLEYATKRFAEQTSFRLLARQPIMPDSMGGTIAYDVRGLSLRFEATNTSVRMRVHSSRFGGQPLHAELDIERAPDCESLNVVVPWNRRTFQFTSKQHCLPTSGNVEWGGETFAFDRTSTYATLDYGRGIWPYRTAWNWASFSGKSGKDLVGINMGAKWTDGTGANENGILLNGTLHKIFEDIRIDYSPGDFMKPWRMKTEASDTVDLTFVPFYEKATKANLVLLRSDTHQMFGYYSGALNVAGRAVRINDVLGMAEENVARW